MNLPISPDKKNITYVNAFSLEVNDNNKFITLYRAPKNKTKNFVN